MIEGLKPYAEYKESGLPWAGIIPNHWSIKRGKALFAESQLPVRDHDEIVTCFRDGQVTLRRNRRASGFMMALYEAGYQGVREGQLVVHSMDAFAGAIGVSDSDGKCSPEYIVTNPRSVRAVPRYYALLLRFAAHQGYILVSCPAVRERAPRFRYAHFGDMQMPLPPADEQAAIVRFLYHANRKIDGFILAKRRQATLLGEVRQSVTEQALCSPGTRSLRLGVVAERVERAIDRHRHQVYTPIGLFNRGRGMFHKQPIKGADLGDSEFFWIEDSDLVLSGQFAWEGAIALASSQDSGCVASHRYPILRGRPQFIASAALLAFFKTQYGALLLDHHSRGAAGRNRPLNASSLMKEKIPVPPLSAQQRIIEIVLHEARLADYVRKIVQAVSEYRTRLTADIVTGKLDVREAAAKLPETGDTAEPLRDAKALDEELLEEAEPEEENE